MEESGIVSCHLTAILPQVKWENEGKRTSDGEMWRINEKINNTWGGK